MSIHLIESPWGVRWSSLAMLALIVLVVTAARRRPFLALVTAMGWLVAFEIVYEGADAAVHHKSSVAWAFWLLTVAAWPLLAHFMGVRPHLRWVLLSAAIFALWIQQGFWYNWPGQGSKPINWWYEALNVGSKTALGVAYLLGALWPERSASKLEYLHGVAEHVKGLRSRVDAALQLARVGARRQVRNEDPAGAGLSKVR